MKILFTLALICFCLGGTAQISFSDSVKWVSIYSRSRSEGHPLKFDKLKGSDKYRLSFANIDRTLGETAAKRDLFYGEILHVTDEINFTATKEEIIKLSEYILKVKKLKKGESLDLILGNEKIQLSRVYEKSIKATLASNRHAFYITNPQKVFGIKNKKLEEAL